MKMPMQPITGSRDAIIDAQRDTQAIKARTKIGSARRNANGYLLHRLAPPQRVYVTMLDDPAV